METKIGTPAGQPATAAGFQGAVGNLPLVDLLQVWSMNGFSGLVTVTSPSGTGRIYFAAGAIVHADAPGVLGEAAVAAIIGWPQGSFEQFPNTAALAHTIDKSVSHLLLDVHRILDERRRAAPPPAVAPRPPAAATDARAVLGQLRAIPGVLQLVRFGPDGRPVGDPSPGAEALAARALYVALNHASAIARGFGLHGFALATLRTARDAVVVVHVGANYLALSVAPDAALDEVAAQVRALLSRSAPR
jgi:hypothetical protein